MIVLLNFVDWKEMLFTPKARGVYFRKKVMKTMHSFIFAPYCVFCKNNRNKDKGKEMKINQALFAHTA